MKNIVVYNFQKQAVLITACFFVTLILLSACGSVPAATEPVPTPTETAAPKATKTPYVTTLIVDPSQKFQTVEDVGGGNFVHRFGGTGTALEPVSQMNIQELSPSIGRVSMDLDLWEPVNDDEDPLHTNEAGFIEEPGSSLKSTFEFLKLFDDSGSDQILIGSIWSVPDWMVTNPDDDSARNIPPENYPEAIEAITAWILRAKQEYDVDIDYVSFNEANIGVNVSLSSDDYAAFIQQAGPRFTELGIKTKWLLGDASNMKDAVSFAEWIYHEPAIRPYLGPLSYHSWDFTTSDQTLKEIAQFAEENSLEVWCTEGGWNPFLWKTPYEYPTWTNAQNLAIIYTRQLKLTRASRFLYWEMMGGDYSTNDGQTPYPILSFLSELKRQFPPGAQIVFTGEDGANVKYVAAQTDDHFVLLVVNRFPRPEPVDIQGLPPGSYTLIRSTRTANNQPVWTLDIKDGFLTFDLAASSINFLTTLK